MPIYEYICQKCGYSFDELVLRPTKRNVSCPKCGSKKIKKMISRFASPCATCPRSSICKR